MNYGLHLASTGALVALHRVDVLAANLANVDTPGFQPVFAAAMQREAARAEDGLWTLPSNVLVERLGGGVLAGPTRMVRRQGPMVPSSEPLDLALEGNGFFLLRDEGDAGPDLLRVTRDGRLRPDGRGRLVSLGSGLPVLDVNGREIRLGPGPVDVAGDGTIRQGGEVVARLAIVDVADVSRLTPAGGGAWRGVGSAQTRPARALVRQGMLERSGVDAIAAMLAITDAARAVEGNLALARAHDRLMERAIGALGRAG